MVKKVKEVEHEVPIKKRLARYINNKKLLFNVLSVRAPRTCFLFSPPEHRDRPCSVCSFIDHHEHIRSFADHHKQHRVILFSNLYVRFILLNQIVTLNLFPIFLIPKKSFFPNA